MERFRFGEQEGFNGRKTTVNGFLSIFGEDRCHVEIAGPKGGERAMLILDKATARKLGAALLEWAGFNMDVDLLVKQIEWLAGLQPWTEEQEGLLNLLGALRDLFEKA